MRAAGEDIDASGAPGDRSRIRPQRVRTRSVPLGPVIAIPRPMPQFVPRRRPAPALLCDDAGEDVQSAGIPGRDAGPIYDMPSAVSWGATEVLPLGPPNPPRLLH